MANPESSPDQRPELWALGPLPPPVTGMTLLTEKVLERLRAAGPVTFLNWSPSAPANPLRRRLQRFVRTLGCLARLMIHGRVENARLYIVASSRAGLFMTGLLATVGRGLGYHVCLHHHTYFYIDRYDWRMAWINRRLGRRGTHVVHCRQMAEQFAARYPGEHQFEYLLPSVFALPIARPREAAATPLRIGHMGNLMVSKGLDLVLETFRNLRERGRLVELYLAGPFETRAAERLVRQAIDEHPDSVRYIGPVYGQAKAEYFQSIDCFLFPSRSESWGIVLNEALAAGVPVIARDRGCTATLVGDGAGLLVADESRLVDEAAQQIESWIDREGEFQAASRAAVEQAEKLNQRGQLELTQFAARMFAPLPG